MRQQFYFSPNRFLTEGSTSQMEKTPREKVMHLYIVARVICPHIDMSICSYVHMSICPSYRGNKRFALSDDGQWNNTCLEKAILVVCAHVNVRYFAFDEVLH